MKQTSPQLTMGSIHFHWPADKWRDFYFKIADEAPVDTVYLGEVVCSKRAIFTTPHYAEVVERLVAGGKKVVFSTLSEVMLKLDRNLVDSICETEDFLVEANDASALWRLTGQPHAIGPLLNVYSEDTLAFLAGNGAQHVALAPELPAETLNVLSQKAQELNVTLEAQVYGRMSLALSARCYHARAHDRVKSTCKFICEEDPDGLDLKTLDQKPILSINGIQTLSYTCLSLVNELKSMKEMGITHFRLSPHNHDMVEVARIFRDVLDDEISPHRAEEKLEKINPDMPFSNGFYHKKSGYLKVS